jgi:hypothetical protein
MTSKSFALKQPQDAHKVSLQYSAVWNTSMSFTFHVIYTISRGSVRLWTDSTTVDRQYNCGQTVQLWTDSTTVDRQYNCGQTVQLWTDSTTAYLKAQTPLTLLFFSYYTEYNVKASLFIFALLLNIFSVVLSSLQQRTNYIEVLLVSLLRHCVKLRSLWNMKLPSLKVLLSRVRISAERWTAETERSCAPVTCSRLKCSNLE